MMSVDKMLKLKYIPRYNITCFSFFKMHAVSKFKFIKLSKPEFL